MAGFAFFLLTPLLVYCIIQTVGDYIRRSWIMLAFGVAIDVMLLFAHWRVIEQMPGSR